MAYIDHELIKPGSVEHRDYQANISASATKESTLVVLPTGLGKTVIALIVIAETLKRGTGKILFMAPTKPLVEQHAKFLREHLVGFEPAVFTGEVHPDERAEVWENCRVVVSTPQVVENDLDEGRVELKKVDLIVFDEAHRAVGDYAYVTIGRRYQEVGGLVLGMTASPGSDVAKIAEVCENLGITNVEIRSEFDEDVVKYTQDVAVEYIKVDMPEGMARVNFLLEQIKNEQVEKLKAMGFIDPKKQATTRDLLEAGMTIRARLSAGVKNYNLFRAASAQALAMKVNHGIELAQTQGRGALESYIEKLVKQAEEQKGQKAAKDLVKDHRFQQARTILYSMEADHPKLEKIEPIIRHQFLTKPDSRVIVFTHYRDTCENLTRRLEKMDGLRPVRFVGQASKGEDVGLNQKEQKEIIDRFQRGDYNVLVATSIAEEGLDIPATDLVIFYEPVPSEIRTIQRRGRTGRRRAGRVIILVTKDTRDEAYFWSSRKKEMQMRRELDSLRKKLRLKKGLPAEGGPKKAMTKAELEKMLAPEELSRREETALKLAEAKGQKMLGQFDDSSVLGPTLEVSSRVSHSQLAASLSSAGFSLKETELEAADIAVSRTVAVAVRSVHEFIDEMSDGSIMSFLAKMKHAYLHPILIVQGRAEGQGEETGNAAIYDALSALLSEFHMPILSTSGPTETASAIASLYRQEEAKHAGRGRNVQTTLDATSRQLLLVQGLPNVSATLAQRLLERFGSVKGIAEADVKQLMEVEGIGRVIAEGIHTVLRRKFGEE